MSILKVYLDNCCFNRPFDDQSQLKVRLETEAKLEIQSKVKNRELSLVWSYILDYENEANPFVDHKKNISNWRWLASIKVAPSDTILHRAEQYKLLGLRAKDSLHLACAVDAECALFITTDKGILNKNADIPEIKISNPIEFIMET